MTINIINKLEKFGKAFPYHKTIARYLRYGATTVELRELAEQLYNQYLAGKSFKEQINIYEQICLLIDRSKVLVLDHNGPTTFSNSMMLSVGYQIIKRIDLIRSFVAGLALQGEANRLEKSSDELDQWLYPKIYVIWNALTVRVKVLSYVQGLSIKSPSKQLEQITQFCPDVDQALTQMMDELRQLRQYGIKSCYFKDGIMHGRDQAWVFLDPSDFDNFKDEYMVEISDIVKQMTTVCLAEEKFIQECNARFKRVKSGSGEVLHVDFGFTPHMVLSMDMTGELFFDQSMLKIMPLRDVFTDLGKADHYQLFKYAHMLRLWDLVVPLIRVRQTPQLMRSKNGWIERMTHISDPSITPDLILPRIRLIEDHSAEIRNELTEEVDAADIETSHRIGHHNVTDHVRHLPLGKKASPEAVSRAILHGITLHEGETYVRKHERGSGDDTTSKIYRVVKRKH